MYQVRNVSPDTRESSFRLQTVYVVVCDVWLEKISFCVVFLWDGDLRCVTMMLRGALDFSTSNRTISHHPKKQRFLVRQALPIIIIILLCSILASTFCTKELYNLYVLTNGIGHRQDLKNSGNADRHMSRANCSVTQQTEKVLQCRIPWKISMEIGTNRYLGLNYQCCGGNGDRRLCHHDRPTPLFFPESLAFHSFMKIEDDSWMLQRVSSIIVSNP